VGDLNEKACHTSCGYGLNFPYAYESKLLKPGKN
jgi:hypothetical protein